MCAWASFRKSLGEFTLQPNCRRCPKDSGNQCQSAKRLRRLITAIPETREAILIEKEHEREPGWLTRFALTATSETEANHDVHRKAT